MAEQFKVGVPYAQRIGGRIYDFHSGICMGLASDEQKKKYEAGQVFNMNIAGCPHKLIIHPMAIVIDFTKNYEWCYSRSRGDIEVFAPNESEALRLVKETGLVKHVDPKRLKRTSDKLSNHLKKEEIT